MSDGYERKLREYRELPHTVIGTTIIPQKFSLFLRGEGLKKIVEQMREGEDLRITVYAENYLTKFEIVDTHKKYPKQGAETKTQVPSKEGKA